MQKRLLLTIFLLSSCSKISYIVMQGKSQIALELRGQSVENYLEDQSNRKENLSQVRAIQKYKKFFYKYFDEKSTSIYDSVTIVPNDIVTYLVVASPISKIKPIMHRFPIVGEFPYLGFFEKNDALEFEKLMQSQGYSTYLRNVYAYSTLNQWIFNDNILSSFFHYKGRALARLIFHELVHTIFFVPDEVAFNESLAQYISDRLTNEYFDLSNEDISKYEQSKKIQRDLNRLIVGKSKELNSLYKKNHNHLETLDIFLNTNFIPSVRSFCIEYKTTCWPLDEKWNNARFAAFNTYEEKVSTISRLQDKHKLSIKELFTYLKKEYKTYKNLKKKDTFEKYLKR